MKIVYELNATKNHYHYVMGYGHAFNYHQNKGTITLIGVMSEVETYNHGYARVKNYKYTCRNCGWDFKSKNTYERAGNKAIHCPNCGYEHQAEGTAITDNADKPIPIYYNIKLKALKEKLLLELKTRGEKQRDIGWENKESFIFDIKNCKVIWRREDYLNNGKDEIELGYIEDNIKELTALSCFSMETEDDNHHKFAELMEVLAKEINAKMKELHGFKTRSLKVRSNSGRVKLFDGLMKMAHKVRFWESPELNIYGDDKNVQDWYRENYLNSLYNKAFEKGIEAFMRKDKLSYYDAARKFFNIPDIESFRRFFSYKNMGLYKELESKYKNNAMTNLIFQYAATLPGFCSWYTNKRNNLKNLFITGCDTAFRIYPDMKMDFIEQVVKRIYEYVKTAKQDDNYKKYVKRFNRDGEDYLKRHIETEITKAVFEETIKNKAEQERKNFYQMLSEETGIPNNVIFRKCYKFELIKSYQEIYTKYSNVQEANELVENALAIYDEAVYRKQEEVDTYLAFYATFKAVYPETITPCYVNAYVKNKKNHPDDCVKMFKALDETSLEKFYAAKPRMKELHDQLMVLTNLQKHSEKIFDIPEDVVKRTEMFLNNTNLTIIKKYSDLLVAGNALHNCAASYRDRINSNHYLVLATDSKGLPVALLEIKANAIIQAKLMSNRPVHNDEVIQKTVLEFAEAGKYKIETNDIKLSTEADLLDVKTA